MFTIKRRSFIFSGFVNFDELYAHRRDKTQFFRKYTNNVVDSRLRVYKTKPRSSNYKYDVIIRVVVYNIYCYFNNIRTNNIKTLRYNENKNTHFIILFLERKLFNLLRIIKRIRIQYYTIQCAQIERKRAAAVRIV